MTGWAGFWIMLGLFAVADGLYDIAIGLYDIATELKWRK